MIDRDSLVKIGKFNKPHGIKGEISFSFTDDSFDEVDNPFLVCELEGIFVPFRIESYRFTSDTAALVKLKNINSEKNVQPLTNKDVYFPKKDIVEKPLSEEFTWDYFLGYKLRDEKLGDIGTIKAVDDTTINTLFVVDTDKGEVLVPANEKVVNHIDEAEKIILVELPEGLLEI